MEPLGLEGEGLGSDENNGRHWVGRRSSIGENSGAGDIGS